MKDNTPFKGYEPFGKMPEQINEWIRDDKLRVFNLPTPRGLAGFYEVAGDDYAPRKVK